MKKFIVSKVFLLLLVLSLSFTFVGCDLSNFGFSFGLDDNGDPVIEDDEGNKANIDVDNEQVEKLFYRFSNGKYSYEEWKNALSTDDVEIYFDGKTLSYSYKDEGAKIDLVNYDLLVQELAALSCNMFDSGSALYYQLNNGSWIFLCNYTVEEGKIDENEYTVYFIVEGERETVKVKGSNKLTHTDPYKEGYRFVGWELNGTIVILSTVNLQEGLVFIAVFEEIDPEEIVLTKQYCSKTTHSLGSTDTLFASFKGYYNGYFSLYFSGVYGVSYSDFKLIWKGGEIGLGEYLKNMGDMDGFTIDDEGSLIKSGYINIDYRQLAGEHPEYSFLQLRYIGEDTNVRFTVTSYYLIDENHQNYLEIYRDGVLCDTIAITVSTIYSLESYALPGYEITGWHTNNGLSGDNFSPTFWDIYDLPTKLYIEYKKQNDKENINIDDYKDYNVYDSEHIGNYEEGLGFIYNQDMLLRISFCEAQNIHLNNFLLRTDMEEITLSDYLLQYGDAFNNKYENEIPNGSYYIDLSHLSTENKFIELIFIPNSSKNIFTWDVDYLYDITKTYLIKIYNNPNNPNEYIEKEITYADDLDFRNYVEEGYFLKYYYTDTGHSDYNYFFNLRDNIDNSSEITLVLGKIGNDKYTFNLNLDGGTFSDKYFNNVQEFKEEFMKDYNAYSPYYDYDLNDIPTSSYAFNDVPGMLSQSIEMYNKYLPFFNYLFERTVGYDQYEALLHVINGYDEFVESYANNNEYTYALSYEVRAFLIGNYVFKQNTLNETGYYDNYDNNLLTYLYYMPISYSAYDISQLPIPTREGYKFLYWIDCSTGNINYTDDKYYFVDLLAVWEEDQTSSHQYDCVIPTEYEIMYYGESNNGRYTTRTDIGTFETQEKSTGFSDVSIFIDNKLFPLPKYALINIGIGIFNDTILSTPEELQVYNSYYEESNMTTLIYRYEDNSVIASFDDSTGHGALYYNSSNYNITISDVTLTYGRNTDSYGYSRYAFRYDKEHGTYYCEKIGSTSGTSVTLAPNEYLWCPATAERHCTGLTDNVGSNGVLGSLSNGKQLFIVNTWDYVEKIIDQIYNIPTEYEIAYYGLDNTGKYRTFIDAGNYNSQLQSVGFSNVSIFAGNKLFPLPKYALIDLGRNVTDNITLSTKEELQVYGTDGSTQWSTGLIIKDGIITPMNSYGHGALYYNSSNYNITISDVKMTYGRNLNDIMFGYNRYIFRYNEEYNIYICEYVNYLSNIEITLYPNDYLWCPMTAERFCTGLTDCDGSSGILGSLADGKQIIIVRTWDYIEREVEDTIDDEMYDITYVCNNYKYGIDGYFDSFEEAIAHTNDYGTIKIDSGEYDETFHITKPVTILGPNYEKIGMHHDVDPAILYGGIELQASNVKISGFNIKSYINFDVNELSDITISNNIFDIDYMEYDCIIGSVKNSVTINCSNLTIEGNYAEAIPNYRFLRIDFLNGFNFINNFLEGSETLYDYVRVPSCASGTYIISNNVFTNANQSVFILTRIGQLDLKVFDNIFNNITSTAVDTRNYMLDTKEYVNISVIHNTFNTGFDWSPIRVRNTNIESGYIQVDVKYNIFNDCWCYDGGYKHIFENSNRNNSTYKYLNWECNYIKGETSESLTEEMFDYAAYNYSGVNSIDELEEAYAIANGLPYNNDNLANLTIDFMDGTVSNPYTSANWKQEKYTTEWIEVSNQMNCREKNGERVVNFANGYSMPMRFTYSKDNIGIANSLTLRLGNYFSQADNIYIKIIIEDTDGIKHYIAGSVDSFDVIPVTEGLMDYGYAFEKIDVKSLIFITKSDLMGGAYLYVGNINLVYNN